MKDGALDNEAFRGRCGGRLTLLRRLLTIVFCLACVSPAHGHAAGENYVWFNIDDTHIEGRFVMRLSDLRQVLSLDIPEDYDDARDALAASADVVHAYILEHFEVTANDSAVVFEFGEVDLLRSERLGHFARYHYRTPSFDIPDELQIRNTLLFEGNASRLHRSLLCIDYNKKSGIVYSEGEDGDPSQGEQKRVEFAAMVFGPRTSEQTLDLTDVTGLIPVREFVWQGILHIWIGIDHILFLVALLLPAVLLRTPGGEWQPAPNFKSAFWNIIKIVTLFTIAHSITLSLAALDIVQVPSRLVETAIAVSIVVVALNNVFPVFRETTAWVILFFGLFHGLGFATVMGELPFRMISLMRVVLLFNFGVEVGQIAIVALVFPVIFLARRSRWYRPVVVGLGSFAIAALASWWVVQRAFDL